MIACPDYDEDIYELTYDEERIVNNQMNKSICKIKNKSSENKIGFFCSIKFPDILNMLNVLISENIVLYDKNKIEFTLNENDKSYEIVIDNNRKIYINNEYNICFIEIKQSDKLDNISFLSISEDINLNFEFSNNIYILYFSENMAANYSIGYIYIDVLMGNI